MPSIEFGLCVVAKGDFVWKVGVRGEPLFGETDSERENERERGSHGWCVCLCECVFIYSIYICTIYTCVYVYTIIYPLMFWVVLRGGFWFRYHSSRILSCGLQMHWTQTYIAETYYILNIYMYLYISLIPVYYMHFIRFCTVYEFGFCVWMFVKCRG